MFSTIRLLRLPFLLFWILSSIQVANGAPYNFPDVVQQRPLGYPIVDDQKPIPNKPDSHVLPDLLHALDILQEEYFAVWAGIWPKSIDWTSAVIGTYLSAALTTLSTSFPSFSSSKSAENIINKYFSQLTASYFGQDAFALRQEAYDDMLWVVLGWLESIRFIKTHSALHYKTNSETGSGSDSFWHGEQWIPAFAHRARIFWDMASQGWDTELCNGGMIWSPYLLPYKNAITNELYVAASISMYLYFPGDENTSPFAYSSPIDSNINLGVGISDGPAYAHDPKYLAAAVEGYKWLMDSNMTDGSGLYIDGFHISGWSRERDSKNRSENTRCDARNEMVYTYNQGVLLTGQRGLYEATGARSYLQDGHKLIRDVIAATGWDLKRGRIIDEDRYPYPPPRGRLGKWHGLGRSGILEEACDAPGYCSQDAQTFKGIFFHHLTSFCSQLPEHLVFQKDKDTTFLQTKEKEELLQGIRKWHDEKCQSYGKWIKRNSEAAMGTRDSVGRFGMWWGAPKDEHFDGRGEENKLPVDAVDYRNQGVPDGWVEASQKVNGSVSETLQKREGKTRERDLNERGRGRTVETQGGGVSVLRARWEVIERDRRGS